MNKELEDKNIYLKIIKTNKFKSLNISFDFRDNTQSIYKKNIAMEIIKTYVDSAKMKQKLMNYYGIKINTTTLIRNDCISEIINIEALSPIFVRDKEYTLEKIILLIPEIFNEIIELNDDEFEDILNESIDSLYDKSLLRENMSVYNALTKFVLNIENSRFNSLNRLGESCNYKKNFSVQELKNMFKNIMYNNLLNIYIIGNVEKSEVENIILKIRKNESKKYISKKEIYKKKATANDVIEIIEQGEGFNSNLVLGFSIDIGRDNSKYIEMKVLEIILGGPNGMLFESLREKNKLTYSIAAQYNIMNKSLLISLIINKDLKSRSEKIIKDIIIKIKNGDISDEKLEFAKNMYKQMMLESIDSPKGMFVIGEILQFNNYNSLNSYIEKIDEISKKDIIELSSKMFYKGSYFIEGSN